MIADQFEDDQDYGAQQILIASASSKTAIGLAYALRARADRPETIGMTSPAHVAQVEALDLYDRVIGYDAVDGLDASKRSALVDLAGNGAVTRAVHERFGDALVCSMVVGKSHWDAADEGGALPGPQRMGFFAPGRSEKRISDWGGELFQKPDAQAWGVFMALAPDLTEIVLCKGGEGALQAYRDMVAGDSDPLQSLLVEP